MSFDVTIDEIIAAFRKAVHAQDIHSSSGFGDSFAERVSMARVNDAEARAECILNTYIDQRIAARAAGE